MNKEYALVLEGGGAKCAYEVGAIIALQKYGYSFNIISGASYGAFNGAMYITGGVEHLLNYYNNIDLKQMFTDDGLRKIIEDGQSDQSTILSKAISYCLSSNEYHEKHDKIADEYRALIKENIDIEKIKESPIEFYCSVLKVNNDPITTAKLFKAFATKTGFIELYQSKSIEGRIVSKEQNPLDGYIMASANYPVHPALKVNDEYFYDGGIYDNCPYRHLIYKGIKKIIIVRTHNDRPLDIESDNENIIVITPSRNLGCTLSFTQDNIQELIKLGYKDAEELLRKIHE